MSIVAAITTPWWHYLKYLKYLFYLFLVVTSGYGIYSWCWESPVVKTYKVEKKALVKQNDSLKTYVKLFKADSKKKDKKIDKINNELENSQENEFAANNRYHYLVEREKELDSLFDARFRFKVKDMTNEELFDYITNKHRLSNWLFPE